MAFPVQSWLAQLAFSLFTVMLVHSVARCVCSFCIWLNHFAFGLIILHSALFNVQLVHSACSQACSPCKPPVQFAVGLFTMQLGVLSGPPGFSACGFAQRAGLLSLQASSVCSLAQFAIGVFTLHVNALSIQSGLRTLHVACSVSI